MLKKLGIVLLVVMLLFSSLPTGAFAKTILIPQPVSLEVNPTSLTLEPGQTVPFQATVKFSDGSTKDAAHNGVFIVSNSRVAKVANGYITALTPGNASIYIRSYGKMAVININVKEVSPKNQDPVVIPTRAPKIVPVVNPSSNTATQKPAAISLNNNNQAKEKTPANIQPTRSELAQPVVVRPTNNIPNPVKLEVNPTNVTLQPGQSQEFHAALTFSDGSVRDATQNAVFIVSNRNVATVGGGKITALGPGNAIITMRTYGLVKTINVTVTQPKAFTVPKPVKLEVNPTNVTLQPGQSQEFHAALTFSDGSVRDVTQNAVFIVSNRNVATVGGGKIVALGLGNATITMQSYGLTARIDVTVQEAKIQEAKPVKIVVPQSLTLKAGETRQVQAVLTYSDGSSKDITLESVWTTSDSRIATVSGGKITALMPGSAIITVNSNGLSGSIEINVAAEDKPPITKTIEWQYNGKTFKEELKVPADLVAWDKNVNEIATKFFKSDPFTQQKMLATMSQNVKELVLALSSSNKGNVSPWVKEPQNIAYISTLARSLQEKAQKEGYDRFQTAEFILSFVQAIPYVQHAILQLPAQTLIENGDCDDRSVLLGAILRSLGYEVALLHYSDNTHMNLGVAFDKNEVPQRGYAIRYYEYQGKRYYIAETTSHDPRIGVGPFWRITEIFPVK